MPLVLTRSFDSLILHPAAGSEWGTRNLFFHHGGAEQDSSYFRINAVNESSVCILHTGPIMGIVFCKGSERMEMVEPGTEFTLHAGDRYQFMWGCDELFLTATDHRDDIITVSTQNLGYLAPDGVTEEEKSFFDDLDDLFLSNAVEEDDRKDEPDFSLFEGSSSSSSNDDFFFSDEAHGHRMKRRRFF